MASPKARKVSLSKSKILRGYAEKTPGSAKLYLKARDLFPGAVTHVGRYLKPHPLFVARAAASRKWDVDGNEYVDYFGGHGALMLGHNHPVVLEAVEAQIKNGSHYGASHELEVEWAQLIHEMVPCAERIRFTSSGTEATMLAMRVARAFTRKNAVLRFHGHFHGWHDQAAASTELAPGIPKETAGLVVLCPPNDIAAFKQTLESRSDIAAVILEPTGATFGQIPTPVEFLYELRELTRRHRILLIFDEVITGFRCSPGGVQWEHGITPDLVTLAKIVAGGYPGGVLAGRSDILEVLQHREGEPIAGPPVAHQGTFNANPVSAAAGVATLRLIRDGGFISKANQTAAAIRKGLNDVLKR
ncbi:MAG: aspartate aminotransferase family protein, partial [Bryobacteraceae bacterium]